MIQTRARRPSEREPDYIAHATRELLVRRRAEVERFIAWGRLAFTLVFLARGLIIGALAWWKLVELALPAAVSVFAFRRARPERFTEGDLVIIVVGDTIVGGVALGGNIFEHHAAPYVYLGLFRMPDIAIMIFLVTLAAFRFSAIGVLGSALASALASVTLAWVDRSVHGGALGYDGRELSVHLIVLAATAALGIFSATRMRVLLMDQALTLLREQRAQRNLDEVLRDSHDVRASLQAALIDAELMCRGEEGSPEQRQKATSVRDNLENVAAHLARMRRFSSQEADAARQTESAALADTIEDAVRAMRIAFPEVEIVSSGLPAERVYVVGGARGLRRIADNLLRNACEGIGDRRARSVRISGSVEREILHLVFEDDGPGFAPAIREALASGRAVTTKAAGGSGFGIVRWTIEESDGTLAIADGTDGGARVVVGLRRG